MGQRAATGLGRIGWLALLGSALVGGTALWRVQPHPTATAARERLPSRPLGVGDRAPEFALSDLGGRRWVLSQQRGRRVLLCFYCGCEPCRRLAYAAARRRSAWKQVAVFVVVYMDPDGIRAFRRDTGLQAAFLVDSFGDVGAAYGSLSCPRCWVIGEAGQILYTNRGPSDSDPGVVQEIGRVLGSP